MNRLCIFCLLFIVSPSHAQHNIIPVPVSYVAQVGSFVMTDKTKIVFHNDNAEVRRIAEFCAKSLKINNKPVLSSKSVEIVGGVKSIQFFLNQLPKLNLGSEGYELEVGQQGIKINANHAAGLFYAVQTLRQLGDGRRINHCSIVDYPRFGWRGLMLDVSRHFFTKSEVMDFIDLMAQYKYNTLHWHLTDDNGWRIEIKSLPKLTEIGAWRVQRTGHFGDREAPKDGEPTTYGGFYTQDEIREVVRYAAQRNVTIVPEIDVPGHSMAALAAYPELSTRKEPKKVNPGSSFAEWYGNGKFKMLIENTLNPGDERVYTFMEKVINEVAPLFPSKYFHIGGDEAYHGYWDDNADCKEKMAKNNLKDTHELQSYFIKRCEQMVMAKGKTLIGWDEILEGGLAPNAAVMSWRGLKGGIEAAKQKHDVV